MAPSTKTGTAVDREEKNPFEPLETIPLITENGRSTGVVTDVNTLNTLADCIATLEDLLQTRLMPATAAAAKDKSTATTVPSPLLHAVREPSEKTPSAAAAMQAVKTAVTLATVAPIIQTSKPPPVSTPSRLHSVKTEPLSIPPLVRTPEATPGPSLRAVSIPPATERSIPPLSAPPSFVPAPSYAPRSLGRLPRSASADVGRLLSTFGCADFEYREVAAHERAARSAAEANVALAEIALPGTELSGPNSLEPTPGPKSTPPAVRRRRSMVQMPTFAKDPRIPWTVALVSTKPWSGRTTIAANLAVSLAQDSWSTVAVGLDPRNDLAAHFGIDPTQRFGVAAEQMSLDHLRWNTNGVRCVPFGATDSQSLPQVESALAANDRWLEQRLLPLASGDSEIWVLDTPSQDSVILRQALSLADMVLVVVTPEADTTATVTATDALLIEHTETYGKPPPYYVMNRFDSRRSIDRHSLSAVRGQLRERLAPTIHEDVSVQDSLGAGRLLVQTASQSQVVADFAALADWINSRRTAGRDPSQS